MTAVVSKFIVQTLCDNQGCLDFRGLEEKLAQTFTVARPILRSVIFDDGKIAIQRGSGRVSADEITSPDSLIVAKTQLRLCRKKPGECPQCDGLHLCRYHVCGNCNFGYKCKNPHSLGTPYNAELLKKYGLSDMTEKQLFQLLLQNDPFLLPEICPHYNKGNGLHGSCKFSVTCTKLHVCQHYFQGDCKFGSSCKRIHNLNAQGMKILQGFSQENIQNLPEVYRNKFIIMGQEKPPAALVPVLPVVRVSAQQPFHSNSGSPTGSKDATKPTSDVEGYEICLFFIRGNCSFKEKCVRVHWDLPYKWQVLDRDGVTWKDLTSMEAIEEAYCDPRHDTNCSHQLLPSRSSAVPSVDFMRMTCQGCPVRRLSTASSASKPPHFILTTQWLWYWKDDNGKWLEYGQDDVGPSSVTSHTLEKLYLEDRGKEIPFISGKHQYTLNFRGTPGAQLMYQQNVKFKTKREVRRRPRFVSAHDVEVKRKSPSSHGSSSSSNETFPSNWDMNALPEFGFKLVPLSKSSAEYAITEKLFKLTMQHSTINSIQRIQNPSLWKVFHWQKEQMTKRNGGRPVNEQHLFHGTDESLLEAICEQNFDWRMSGVHGTAYGKGSYFAKDASYSDRYARAKRCLSKIMFVALVLVGEYTRGSSSYVRPPPKGNSTTLYDSCVDNENNPKIFVVFEKLQIYPEYVIDYS